MDNIEVLGYVLKSPIRMADFIVFCIGDKPGFPGVFEWLFSRKVKEAHFFTSKANDSIGVFGATILKAVGENPVGVVPWMDNIKGFEDFVSKDGALDDVVHAFPQLTATVTHNQFLDDEFVKRAKPVMDVFDALGAGDRSGFSFTADDFAAALRGSATVNREEIFSEIEKEIKGPLFEKADLAEILKSLDS